MHEGAAAPSYLIRRTGFAGSRSGPSGRFLYHFPAVTEGDRKMMQLGKMKISFFRRVLTLSTPRTAFRFEGGFFAKALRAAAPGGLCKRKLYLTARGRTGILYGSRQRQGMPESGLVKDRPASFRGSARPDGQPGQTPKPGINRREVTLCCLID